MPQYKLILFFSAPDFKMERNLKATTDNHAVILANKIKEGSGIREIKIYKEIKQKK